MRDSKLHSQQYCLGNHKTHLLTSINAENLSSKCNHPFNNKYYQSFIYTDHITNTVMPIDINGIFGKPNGKQCCLGLLKETRKFHIDSLKTKNYRPARNTHSSTVNLDFESSIRKQKQKHDNYLKRKKSQKEHYLNQKYYLSKLLNSPSKINYKSANVSLNQSPRKEMEIKEVSIFEQEENLVHKKLTQDQGKCKNQQNTSIKNHQINSINTYELNQQIQQRNKQAKQQKNNCANLVNNKFNIIQNLRIQCETKSQKQFIQDLKISLRRQITKNAEFLITPKFTKRLHDVNDKLIKTKKNKYHSNQSKYLINLTQNADFYDNQLTQMKMEYQKDKKINKIEQKMYDKQNRTRRQDLSDVSNYTFKLQQAQQIIGRKLTCKYKSERKFQCATNNPRIYLNKKITQYIRKGDWFHIQIQFQMQPNLLFAKQKFTQNNLLHLTLQNNQPKLFWTILKKMGQRKSHMLTQANKYAKTPIQLAKTYQIINNNFSLNDILSDPHLGSVP